MANDTLTKEQVYPCKAAPVEDLDRQMQALYIGHPEKEVGLRPFIRKESPDHISWSMLRHIRIIKDYNAAWEEPFKNAGIPQGFYLNADGSWLLVNLPDKSQPGDYFPRFGGQLESLWIFNSHASCTDFEKLPHLKSLFLQDSWLEHDGQPMPNVPGLESLRINRYERITTIPDLGNLTGLKKLSIINTGIEAVPPWLKKLTQLSELDLSVCLNLTELSGLEHLTALTKLNLSDCRSLPAVPQLKALTNLTDLNISSCDKIKGLPEVENLTQLTSLDLSNDRNLIMLPSLGKLTRLTRLDLSGFESLTQLPGLGNLTQLTELDLSWCESLTQLPGLGNLTQLTRLDLYRCESLAQLPRLENLTHLTYLNLYGCSSLTQLQGLGNLTQLTQLNLYRCSSLTQLQGLGNLTQLTYLNLSWCSSLTQLPGLGSLTQLTRLDLSGFESLTQLPGLGSLTQLTELSLYGCSSLTQLPGLGNLIQLTELDLSECSSLAQLPGLGSLTHLTWLNLSRCSSLTELPVEIRRIKSLRMLDLQSLKLRSLPDWLPDIAERFSLASWSGLEKGKNRAIVYLDDTTVEDMPDMSIFEQPYEMVADFFRNRALNRTHPLNEIKVVFLGDGEAGKSHTIARLINDGGEPDHAVFDGQSTPGIVIRDKEYDLGGRKITVHYWDFGGQEIMHSMHRIFLTMRTMYVILLNARDDTQSAQAKYWLHNVKSFAPDAPVLLVLNKIDQNENASVAEWELRSRYDKLTQVVRLSALKFTRDQFNDSLTRVLLEEIQKTGYLDARWPTPWTQVKNKLENMKTHYIMGSDYQAICEECSVDQNQKDLLHWFNDLGVSFCCDGEDDYTLEDYVILRPDWITNALYIILFNRLEGAQNGLIPHKSIYHILRTAHRDPSIRCTLPTARYSGIDTGYVLGIMRKFNLSFTDGHNNEFIPMLCQQNPTVDIRYYHQDTDTLEFYMEFDYLPNNLLHRMMVERYAELDMTAVWRTGARFQLKEPGYSAVVTIDGSTLCFFIRHSDPQHRPNTYLSMLKAHVDRIVEDMKLKPPACRLIYKMDGKRDEFDYDVLKAMQEAEQTQTFSMTWRKMIPIQDILNQSAPDGLADEKQLLDAIRKSCLNIQAEPDYYLKDGENGRGLEDKRNRRIRDDLQMLGYDVKDQTQRGRSGTGRGIGELDLLLLNDRKEPWAIIEALRVSGGAKTEWDKHLNKLVANYNYFGAPCLYLLTYVDANAADFQRIWDGYQQHIPRIDPGQFTYCAKSLDILNAADDPQHVKTAICRYRCGCQITTAYHIFVRIPR